MASVKRGSFRHHLNVLGQSHESLFFNLQDIDLGSYIDNSEWELLTVNYEKGMRTYACCPEPHPDLTFTLHMRRWNNILD